MNADEQAISHRLWISVLDLDLHRHALEEFVGTRHDRDFWEAAEPFALQGQATRALCPVDRLLHVCTHGLRWNGTPNFHWISDAVLLLRAEGEAFDWMRFARRARAFDLGLPAGEGVRFLAGAFGVAVPAAALQHLTAGGTAAIRRLAYRARQRAPRERGLVDAAALRVEMRRRLRRARNLPAPEAFARQGPPDPLGRLGQDAAGAWRALRVSLGAAFRRS